MTAITHQRVNNVTEIVDLALKLYDAKTEQERRMMFKHYTVHMAHGYSVLKQREWIELLKKNVAKESEG